LGFTVGHLEHGRLCVGMSDNCFNVAATGS
jgi:hypothetical protein